MNPFAKFSCIIHRVPQILDCSRDDAVSLIRFKHFLTKLFLHSGHGIGFAASCLAVGKDSD
jgi:hypothetical protein